AAFAARREVFPYRECGRHEQAPFAPSLSYHMEADFTSLSPHLIDMASLAHVDSS
ncbi:hypothetical protein CSUI_006626, partial [Cystoisospora suis]